MFVVTSFNVLMTHLNKGFFKELFNVNVSIVEKDLLLLLVKWFTSKELGEHKDLIFSS